ncbi:EspA/EspE family type VII secretion system effector [Mycobacterium marinum]|uniref:EspA/EspE family type VII secretion system effector n=1 Tax=Mycobacterium marinum TaxID=1781 RepID=UPI002358E4E2|nr:EspA/EspE family type VII secretion system effector [Mycobacterium marinum]MDC8985602.1 EspA/EspE family type VII secretion system effector [Mycobacterium marinum]MDC9002888.1 EspA/EspE family type VII secretion system effector [Mycobacterium marinum]MDC9013628.1 EspA/EspE family type VII secretion system effector [Mycobacterium marinum]MDC9018987.1 EspA/EspE family type VII secretion system effector [Mycobacterium marinum]
MALDVAHVDTDGDPEWGDRLKDSASMFDHLGGQIAALVPDGGWQGVAAQAYQAQNIGQSRHAELMVDLDRHVAELVSSQAQEVSDLGQFLVVRAVITFLVVLPSCLALEASGYLEFSLILALGWCTTVLAIAISRRVHLAHTTSRNADEVRAAAQRVTDLVAALSRHGESAVGSPVTASPDAGLPSRDGVSQFAVADEPIAPSPPLPDLGGTFAALPGAPEFHLATEAGAGLPDFGAPGLPIPPLTGMPTSLDPAHLPDLPDVSGVLADLPTIAPLSIILGQLGGLAGPTNAASQLANTATQHAQMIATLAQQHTPRADHPTPDHETDSPDTAGAATTTDNQRAPIDTQTRPTHQRSGLLG